MEKYIENSSKSEEGVKSIELRYLEEADKKTKNFAFLKKVEDVREVPAEGVKTINIETDDVDVVVKVGKNSSNISAHFFSDSEFDEIDAYNLNRSAGDSVNLTLNLGKKANKKGNFYVELRVPKISVYCMYVHSNSGSIKINSDGYIRKFWLDSITGNIYFYGSMKEISCFTFNGNIQLSINAKKDVEVDAKTNNGIVDIELFNASRSQMILDTRNGTIKDRFSGSGEGYTVYGRAASYNGNVSLW